MSGAVWMKQWVSVLACGVVMGLGVNASALEPDMGHVDASPDHDSGPDYDAGPDWDTPPDYDSYPDWDSRPDHDSSPDYDAYPDYDSYPDYDASPDHDAYPDWDSYPDYDMGNDWDSGPDYAEADFSLGCDLIVRETVCPDYFAGKDLSRHCVTPEDDLDIICQGYGEDGKDDDGDWTLSDEMTDDASADEPTCSTTPLHNSGLPTGTLLMLAGLMYGVVRRRRS